MKQRLPSLLFTLFILTTLFVNSTSAARTGGSDNFVYLPILQAELDFATPTTATFGAVTDIVSNGDDRLFITEKTGLIFILDGNGDKHLFMNIQDRVQSLGGEQGLFAIAFHPDYANNGYFYLTYTQLDFGLRISRFSVTANPNTADATTETELMTVFESQDYHNGGSLRFSPVDGHLYVGVGDDANGQKAQNSNEVYGKILRLNVGDGFVNSAARFALGGAVSRVQTDIWAMGLRNPWRIAFDELTGNLFVGDVGGSQQEEINIIFNGTPGMNFGWPCLEGSFVRDHEPNCDNHSGFVPAIHTYPHTNGRCAIILGRVDRPVVSERVVFGDYCNQEIHTLSLVEGAWVDEVVGEMPAESPFLTAFGWDNAGILYAGTQSPAPLYSLNFP